MEKAEWESKDHFYRGLSQLWITFCQWFRPPNSEKEARMPDGVIDPGDDISNRPSAELPPTEPIDIVDFFVAPQGREQNEKVWGAADIKPQG